MARLIHRMKQHDLEPQLRLVVLDGTVPVDLTNAAAVVLIVRGVIDRAPMTKHADQTNHRGEVSYDWQAGDTDTVGEFDLEVEAMWPGTRPQTFPVKGYAVLIVEDDLD